MGKMIKILVLVCFVIILFGCSVTKEKETKEPVPVIIETEDEPDIYIYDDGIHSMDWDYIDEGYLLKIAQYKGGTVEDRAYTILVTLNRVWDREYYDSHYKDNDKGAIQNVVLIELYEVDGISPTEFEEIVPDDITKEAMRMVKIDKYNNSNDSLEYR